MARASQKDPAQSTRKGTGQSQADQSKLATAPQRQAGNDQPTSLQQGGSDTHTQFSDWASI